MSFPTEGHASVTTSAAACCSRCFQAILHLGSWTSSQLPTVVSGPTASWLLWDTGLFCSGSCAFIPSPPSCTVLPMNSTGLLSFRARHGGKHTGEMGKMSSFCVFWLCLVLPADTVLYTVLPAHLFPVCSQASHSLLWTSEQCVPGGIDAQSSLQPSGSGRALLKGCHPLTFLNPCHHGLDSL